ncbi:hypothetical protein NXU94_24330 [Bacteroides faecis]|nr:hypothetical protein [Bacteroides faecis]MCS3070098.1 hypothetical protein [Bacteroides faecis]
MEAATDEETFETFATPDAHKGIPIKATFLDEISWDIPASELGVPKKWDQDFKSNEENGNQYRCAHSSRSRQMDCPPLFNVY